MSKKTVDIEQQRAFVEEFGMFYETFGLTRMVGRIIGFLVINNDPLSMGDLVDAIGTTKSAVSVSLKELLQMRLLSRKSKPGSRRDYYELKSDFSERILIYQSQNYTGFKWVAEEGLSLLDASDKEAKDRLIRLQRLFQFLESAIPKVLDLWDNEQSSEKGKPKKGNV